jgi:hypothetical protein
VRGRQPRVPSHRQRRLVLGQGVGDIAHRHCAV